MLGLNPRQFFNQWEAKQKLIAPYTRELFRALSQLQVIATNSDWFISLFAPVVIGGSNYFVDSHLKRLSYGKDINLNCRVDHPGFLNEIKPTRKT